MIWEDVTVTIGADKKKKLPDGVTGFAEPGHQKLCHPSAIRKNQYHMVREKTKN